ncbi:MAG TPA: ATP-binding protein [Longimicrobiaceae bacterium]|nr:ATP-binding protein [Longimicrobiaceae bacterium]
MQNEELLRILVVDDDEVDRMAVRRALRAGGVRAEVREAGDVAAALAALGGEEFDCVFLDYNLPGGDGLRVLRGAREAGLDAPVVMLTGHEDTQTAVELMKAGASDYLSKHALTPERLERSLRAAVRVHRAERQARAAEAALRRSEMRFRVLHETSPDGFMIFRSVRDAAGRIVDFEWVYANPAAERMTHRPAEHLRGKRLLEEMPGNREEGLFDLYVEVVETREPRQVELRYAYEGLDLWARITAVPLEDGFAVGFSDITRRKQAEEEREAVLKARSRFYAAMSHELRTPINAILGYNDLLLAGIYGSLSEKQEEGLERAQRAARHLLDLVNDVLDLSKLEAGKMELVPETVSIPALLQDLLATVRPLAEERGSELRLVEEEAPPTLRTDPRRVQQILLNLISNALKFGRGNPVEVRFRPAPGGGAVLEVVDRGVGIPAADLPHIFEEFVQLPNASEGGTGLGLPISKRLTGLLGGSLTAESVPGEGSTFRLVLPPALPGEEEPTARPDPVGAALA